MLHADPTQMTDFGNSDKSDKDFKRACDVHVHKVFGSQLLGELYTGFKKMVVLVDPKGMPLARFAIDGTKIQNNMHLKTVHTGKLTEDNFCEMLFSLDWPSTVVPRELNMSPYINWIQVNVSDGILRALKKTLMPYDAVWSHVMPANELSAKEVRDINTNNYGYGRIPDVELVEALRYMHITLGVKPDMGWINYVFQHAKYLGSMATTDVERGYANAVIQFSYFLIYTYPQEFAQCFPSLSFQLGLTKRAS